MNINVKLHENKDVYFFCRKQQNLHSQYFCDCCKKDQYLHKCCYWKGICFCDILFRHWLYNLWRFFYAEKMQQMEEEISGMKLKEQKQENSEGDTAAALKILGIIIAGAILAMIVGNIRRKRKA